MKKNLLKCLSISVLSLFAVTSCDELSSLVEDNSTADAEEKTSENIADSNNTKDNTSDKPKEEPKEEEKEEPKGETFKVVWHNGNVILETDEEVVKGSLAEYNGKEPTKNSDDDYDYSFLGWNTESNATTALSVLPTVEKDLDLYAIFKPVAITKYTIKFFNQGSEITGSEVKVKAGTYNIASDLYKLDNPTKAEDVVGSYSFIGWSTSRPSDDLDGTVVTEINVSENMSLHASFSLSKNLYTITWMNDNKTYDTTKHNYGVTPAPSKSNPTKASTAQYKYTFLGWNSDPNATTALSSLPIVTKNDTYYAIYKREVISYLITFKNGNTTLDSRNWDYGSIPSYSGSTPSKAEDDDYTYSFIGWNSNPNATDKLSSIPSVNGEATYYAIFTKTEKPKDMTPLLNDIRYLTSQGDGYTYLDYYLNVQYRDWNYLTENGYLTVDIGYQNDITIISNKLDKLGKGVLEFPSVNKILGNSSSDLGVLAQNKLLDGIVINRLGISEFGCGLVNGSQSLRSVKLKQTDPNYNVCINTIGNYAFSNCTKLVKFEVDTPIKNIMNFAFNGCESLTSLDFSDSSKIILYKGAFNNCKNLTTCNIPDTGSTIPERCFYNCEKLTSLPITSSVSSIEEYAFTNTKAAAKPVTLSSSSTTYVSAFAFNGSGITSLTVNAPLRIQGSSVFGNCDKLTSVSLGSSGSINAIGTQTFRNCTSLATFPFNRYNFTTNYESLFENTAFTSVDFSANTNSNLIGASMFKNCSRLTSVKLNSNIKEIRDSAFEGCNKLSTLTNFNGTNMKLGSYVFKGCTSLSSIPNFTNASFSNYALSGSSITKATIYCGEGLNGEGLFKNNTSLTEATITIGLDQYLQKEMFYGCSSLTTVTLDIYRVPFYIQNGVDGNSIGLRENTFYGCNNLTYINITGTVEQYLNTISNDGTAYQNSLFNIKNNSKLQIKCSMGFYKTGSGNGPSVTLTSSNYQSYLNQM